jgi:Serpentine type 7TM GPCR chemoreceptor Sri
MNQRSPLLGRGRGRLLLVFFIALTVLVSGAYSVYRHYDYSYSADADSYVRMAQGDFYHTSITHRYRWIEPVTVGLVAKPMGAAMNVVWKGRGDSEMAIRFIFFGLNVVLMAIFGVFLYKIAVSECVKTPFAMLSMIFLLTTRWGIDNAGLPLVEALYLLVIAAFARALQTNNWRLLAFAILIGPMAKESFVFYLPLLALFFIKKHQQTMQISNENPTFDARKQVFYIIGLLCLSAIFCIGSRYYIDIKTGTHYQQETHNFVRHLDNIRTNAFAALKPKGWFEAFSAVGLGGIVLFITLIIKDLRQTVLPQIPLWAWAILAAAIVQGLLGEWGRMLYYACPLYVIWLGKGIGNINMKYKIGKHADSSDERL